MKKLAIVFGAMGVVGVTACAEEAIVPVKDCTVWFAEDISSGNQKRMRLFVASGAAVGLERASTGMSVAMQAAAITNYDFVDLFLVPTTAPRNRGKLDASVATAWVQYAPKPQKIPFMDTAWNIKYKTGSTTKVVDEYGNKEYQWESFKNLGQPLRLSTNDNQCTIGDSDLILR